MKFTSLEWTNRFKQDYKRASPDVQAAVDVILALMLAAESDGKLRFHSLQGYDPKIFKVDVFPNHSWQITLNVDESAGKLRRLGRHKDLNRKP